MQGLNIILCPMLDWFQDIWSTKMQFLIICGPDILSSIGHKIIFNPCMIEICHIFQSIFDISCNLQSIYLQSIFLAINYTLAPSHPSSILSLGCYISSSQVTRCPAHRRFIHILRSSFLLIFLAIFIFMGIISNKSILYLHHSTCFLKNINFFSSTQTTWVRLAPSSIGIHFTTQSLAIKLA